MELSLQFKDKQKVLRLKGTDVQNSQVFGGMPKARPTGQRGVGSIASLGETVNPPFSPLKG